MSSIKLKIKKIKLAHASCVDHILHFKNVYFAGIAFICNIDAVKLSHICCEEGFSPQNCSGSRWALGFGVGGGSCAHFKCRL